MTREQTASLIALNAAMYDQSTKSLSDEELTLRLDGWTIQFKDYSYETVLSAFWAANRVCKFPVTVADIFEQLTQNIDPQAEWDALAAAARKAQKFLSWRNYPMVTGIDAKGGLLRSDGTKELQALFEGLPPAAKSYVGSVGGLEELAQTPDLTYRRVEFLKQAREYIATAPREAARLRAGDTPARLEATKCPNTELP